MVLFTPHERPIHTGHRYGHSHELPLAMELGVPLHSQCNVLRVTWVMQRIICSDGPSNLLPFFLIHELLSHHPTLSPLLLFVLVQITAHLFCLKLGLAYGLLIRPNGTLSGCVPHASRLQPRGLLLFPLRPPLLRNLGGAAGVAGFREHKLPRCLCLVALAICSGKGTLAVGHGFLGRPEHHVQLLSLTGGGRLRRRLRWSRRSRRWRRHE
mmetsp:Transcript_65512/g.146173  ORF Transcript_65512/g.146173 Transcript_65512/m.146173 type:complete len:211 (+) Transcript_65512:48-680(+)